ncbi:hypothetical protein GCM10022253_28240 [Sphingomonas endophytica]
MMSDRAAYFWSDAAVDQLCRLKATGLTSGAIAAELGTSRNAVMGRIHRLRAAGDKRVPPAGAGAAVPKRPAKRALVERLAELMALRDPTLASAAFQLGVSRKLIDAAWAQIVADLGWQAS